jgi:hypothetical protein
MDREVKVLMNPVMYADTRQYAYKKKAIPKRSSVRGTSNVNINIVVW